MALLVRSGTSVLGLKFVRPFMPTGIFYLSLLFGGKKRKWGKKEKPKKKLAD
jgi:hypothetical protein